jgi:hypothetical protein
MPSEQYHPLSATTRIGVYSRNKRGPCGMLAGQLPRARPNNGSVGSVRPRRFLCVTTLFELGRLMGFDGYISSRLRDERTPRSKRQNSHNFSIAGSLRVHQTMEISEIYHQVVVLAAELRYCWHCSALCYRGCRCCTCGADN